MFFPPGDGAAAGTRFRARRRSPRAHSDDIPPDELHTDTALMDDTPLDITMELIRTADAGDQEACRELVSKLHPFVSRRVAAQIYRRSDIEDVVQEVFLKLFVKLHQYRGPKPFTHWVARMTLTTCYDWLRRQKARPMVSASDLSEGERRIVESLAEGEAPRQNEVRVEILDGLLDRLIATLAPREQIVIRLLDLEQRSVAEIAELTGWGDSKIKVTASRARGKLAERLERLESS